MRTAIVARPYAGSADLRRMQEATSAYFGRGTYHPGDIAWAMREHAHVLLAPLVTLVESADGAVLGWTWFHVYGWFDIVPTVEPDEVLATALVDAALESAARCVAAGDRPASLNALVDDEDVAVAAALQHRGFAADEARFEVNRRSLDDLPSPTLPEGLRLAAMDDDGLVHPRVEAHRAAFAPSSLTKAGFARVRQTWPYRPELDRVVLDQDGTVLAACLAWIDEATGWGMFEPVGTRPEHQRRGLGAAVCLDALHALRAAGATHAQVSCEPGSAGSATYHSIGFRTERRMAIFRRPLA